jgi:hypothetical protein
MSDAMNIYCKIYVESDLDKAELLQLLARLANGSVHLRTVAAPECEIDVVTNEDFSEARNAQGPDQFLFYPYYLDMEPTPTTTRAHFIGCVGELLEGLWRSGCKAVAACDFESDLPRRGGSLSSTAD